MNRTSATNSRRLFLLSVVFSGVLLAMHIGLYKIGAALSDHIGLIHYVPKIQCIDDLIPIVPAFIPVYVLAYIFWLVCPVVNRRADRQRYADYLVGFAIMYIVGLVWLSLFPAGMDRTAEGLYERLNRDNSLFAQVHLWFINSMDPGEIASCLLPSFHSAASAFCYLGVMRCKEIPKGWRVFIFLYSFSVVLSTLFVKQHYIMDAVSGIALAAVSYALARKFHWGKILLPLFK